MDEIKAEPDIESDDARVDSRSDGGVGRLAADDGGYEGETGAERRAEVEGSE